MFVNSITKGYSYQSPLKKRENTPAANQINTAGIQRFAYPVSFGVELPAFPIFPINMLHKDNPEDTIYMGLNKIALIEDPNKARKVIDNKDYMRVLTDLLTHPLPIVVVNTLNTICNLAMIMDRSKPVDGKIVDSILDCYYRNKDDEEIAGTAILAMGVLAEEGDSRVLNLAIAGINNPNIIKQSLTTLGAVGSREHLGYVKPEINNPDFSTRMSALIAYANLGDRRDIPWLMSNYHPHELRMAIDTLKGKKPPAEHSG